MNWARVEDAIHDFVAGATGIAGKHVVWTDQAIPRSPRPYATLKRVSLRDLSSFDEQRPSYDPNAPAGEEIVLQSYGPRELVVSLQVYSSALTSFGGPKGEGAGLLDGPQSLVRWDEASTPGAWAAETDYDAGDSIKVNRNRWSASEGTSASSQPSALGYRTPPGTVTDGDVTWTLVPDWKPLTAYSVDALVVGDDSKIYRCSVAGTSQAPAAYELVERARSSLSKPSVLAALRAAGVGLVNRAGTRDLSALIETAFESRAQLDVTFSVVDSVTETTTYIETVEVEQADA